MKVTRNYVGGVLETVGCFHKHVGKYENLKIVAVKESQRILIRTIIPVLNKAGVVIRECGVKEGRLFQVADRESIKNLKKFIKRFCVVRGKEC